MITKDELKEYGFYQGNNKIEWFCCSWDYMYNQSTKELFDFNDGVGEPILLTKIYTMEQMVDIILAYSGYDITEKE